MALTAVRSLVVRAAARCAVTSLPRISARAIGSQRAGAACVVAVAPVLRQACAFRLASDVTPASPLHRLQARRQFASDTAEADIPGLQKLDKHLEEQADWYWQISKYEDAKVAYEKLLDVRLKLHGPQHTSVAVVKNNLGQILCLQEKYDVAETLLREAADVLAANVGETSAEVAPVLENLAHLYLQMDRPADAVAVCERVVRIRRSIDERDDLAVGIALREYAEALLQAGDADAADKQMKEALPLLRAALQQREQSGSAVDVRPEVAEALVVHARVKAELGNEEDAASLALSAADQYRQGLDPASLADELFELSELLSELNRSDEAERLLLESHELCCKVHGEQSVAYGQRLVQVGEHYSARSMDGEAEKYFSKAATMLRQHHPADLALGYALYGLGMLRLSQGRETEAAPFLNKAYSMIVKEFGPDSEEAEAVEHLLNSVDGARRRKAGRDGTTRDAADRALSQARRGSGVAAGGTTKDSADRPGE